MVKVRHHVNPLRESHMKPLAVPQRWPEEYFADASQPLHVDIGCARGVFCLDFAIKNPGINVAGLEIRSVLAEAAAEDADALGIPNAAFFATNANVNLGPLLERAAPSCEFRSASIQFPDPWFKAKHHKRRVVKPDLVHTIADHLAEGGWLWMQSDVLELALDMRQTVRDAEPNRLRDMQEDLECWDVVRPDTMEGVATERERASAELGRPVYQSIFVATGCGQIQPA
jgi:tRNA (guanine-N7-)-methyltransferase